MCVFQHPLFFKCKMTYHPAYLFDRLNLKTNMNVYIKIYVL